MQSLTPAYRCPLNRSTTREAPDSIKRQGWKDQRILVISASDDRLDFAEREFIRQIGERLYGEKKHG